MSCWGPDLFFFRMPLLPSCRVCFLRGYRRRSRDICCAHCFVQWSTIYALLSYLVGLRAICRGADNAPSAIVCALVFLRMHLYLRDLCVLAHEAVRGALWHQYGSKSFGKHVMHCVQVFKSMVGKRSEVLSLPCSDDRDHRVFFTGFHELVMMGCHRSRLDLCFWPFCFRRSSSVHT